MDYDSIIPQNLDRPLFSEILVKFTYSIEMIADQNFYDICFTFFYATASASYGLRPKFDSGLNIRLRPKVKNSPTLVKCGLYSRVVCNQEQVMMM